MPSDAPVHPGDSAAPQASRRPFHLLILDDEPEVRHVLDHALASQRVRVHQAGSLNAARRLANQKPLDLALIDLTLPDGHGLELARQLARREPTVPSIVLSGKPTCDDLIEAMRAGACDYLTKPFDLREVNRCVERALHKRRDSRRLAGRVRRLRRICRKLNHARIETTQQVDVLCNDLVTAYHELAGRFKHVQLTSRFSAMIEQELALEPLLYQVLEFILQQLGATNAAVFLPGQESGYTTGGYVNYTFDKETAGIILPHMAEVIAPIIFDQPGELLHLKTDERIREWLGGDGEMAHLDGSHVATFPCRHDDETLAAVCLFRDADDPFDDEQLEALAGIGPILGRQLERVIRVHHRIDFDAADDDAAPW